MWPWAMQLSEEDWVTWPSEVLFNLNDAIILFLLPLDTVMEDLQIDPVSFLLSTF